MYGEVVVLVAVVVGDFKSDPIRQFDNRILIRQFDLRRDKRGVRAKCFP